MIEIVLPDGKTHKVEKGSTFLPLAATCEKAFASPIVGAVLNGKEKSLQQPVDCSGKLDFIELNEEDGQRIYIRTLLFVMLAAAKNLYPELELEVRNTLGNALYCVEHSCMHLEPGKIAVLKKEMQRIIDAESPISYTTFPKEEALLRAEDCCSTDRLMLLRELPDDTNVTLYYLENCPGYFFGPLCPNAGYINYFDIFAYEKGLIIEYPGIGSWDKASEFTDNKVLNSAYQEMEEWAALINCNTVGKLNSLIESGESERIIRIAEGLHEKKIVNIADMVAAKAENLKILLLAGPSSSGKTSTAQRLSVQLEVNGIQPIPISMDDYYKNRTDTPRKDDGSYDFESVEAIDLELFNEHMTKLLQGDVVEIPKFNFMNGVREYRGRKLQMSKNSVLIVEGIHGLNEKLTQMIPAERKLKIYVSAFTPMSLDEYNRINTTDVRLLRRMVRDSKFRSHDAVATLNRWSDVRSGEERFIFPFQGRADIVFNTALIYELAVIKKFAQPLLEAVPADEKTAFRIAQRLLTLLRYIRPIDEATIPNNSILREFIGGSVFKEAL